VCKYVMAISIGGGITISGGVTFGHAVDSTPSINLVLDLDAAAYSAMPVDGTVIAGAGSAVINVLNPHSSMIWHSANGGIFRKTDQDGADFMTFGPNWATGTQPYTVMMIYRSVGTTSAESGRLLNTNDYSPDWLLGLWGSPAYLQNIFYSEGFVGSNDPADGGWQMIWATYNGAGAAQAYVANTTAPQLHGSVDSGANGFNRLRLFGRYAGDTASSEVPIADVGLVKVWDNVLTPAQIQTQWTTYRNRFGLV
jgi:hypothetical protein